MHTAITIFWQESHPKKNKKKKSFPLRNLIQWRLFVKAFFFPYPQTSIISIFFFLSCVYYVCKGVTDSWNWKFPFPKVIQVHCHVQHTSLCHWHRRKYYTFDYTRLNSAQQNLFGYANLPAWMGLFAALARWLTSWLQQQMKYIFLGRK